MQHFQFQYTKISLLFFLTKKWISPKNGRNWKELTHKQIQQKRVSCFERKTTHHLKSAKMQSDKNKMNSKTRTIIKIQSNNYNKRRRITGRRRWVSECWSIRCRERDSNRLWKLFSIFSSHCKIRLDSMKGKRAFANLGVCVWPTSFLIISRVD